MSISTLQEKFKGCFTVAIVVAAGAMGVSMFTSFGRGSSSNVAKGEDGQRPVATVAGVPVFASQIQTQVENAGALEASAQATAYVRATGTAVQAASLRALVAKSGDVSRADIEKAAAEFVNTQIENARMQLMAQGKLKPNASDVDLEKALKDQLPAGKTLVQLRQDAVKNIMSKFADPSTKDGVIALLGGPILTARLGAKAVADEGALRDSFKTYIVRRIFFSAQSGSKEAPEARAAKALADLKAGTPFEKLVDSMSNDAPSGGKPSHGTTETLSAVDLAARPELASLMDKPALTLTPVVDVPGGKAIYQLQSLLNGVPNDFDKNKAKYRDDKAKEAGRAELERQLADVAKSVEWTSLGYKALNAVFEAQRAPDRLPAAIEAAQAATKAENSLDRRNGALAYLAATQAESYAPGADAAKVRADRIAAAQAAQAVGLSDASLSLGLVDLYAETKDGAKAADALVAASKANTRYDAQGLRTFGDIAAKALDLQKKNVLSKAQLEAVQAQQTVWSAARAEDAKASSMAKNDEAAQKKANEEEIARQKAEAEANAKPADVNATKKANDAEIARQKAETGKPKAPATTSGGSTSAGGR